MRKAGKVLYERFMQLTSQNKYVIPWEELPDALQLAWGEVYKLARETKIDDD